MLNKQEITEEVHQQMLIKLQIAASKGGSTVFFQGVNTLLFLELLHP